MKFEFDSIGVIRTPFRDKFGVPRQSGLTEGARGVIHLLDEPGTGSFLRAALQGLEGFSHIWVLYVFHETGSKNWKPSVRPPRLGGAKKVGVLATRSPHRPNPIGMSVLKIVSIDAESGLIEVSGVDMLDGTPILDIKPYLAYCDSIKEASAGWASDPIERVAVEFDPSAREKLSNLGILRLATEILELDPRPAFQKRKIKLGDPNSYGKGFGIRIGEADVKWEIRGGKFLVTDVVK